MKIVIQCAASKDASAGTIRSSDGTPVMFVADPASAPSGTDVLYARPDDLAHDQRPWRDHVVDINAQPGTNPFGLLPAYRLYTPPEYGALVDYFGANNVYVLSAGWGLISAGFLTPTYDITFSSQAPSWKRRRARETYADFNMLDNASRDPVVFFGGKAYLPLFCRLTRNFSGERVAVYNSKTAPEARAALRFVRYRTSRRTNWHYEAINAFLRDQSWCFP